MRLFDFQYHFKKQTMFKTKPVQRVVKIQPLKKVTEILG